MDDLVALTENQASNSKYVVSIDEARFVEFMKKIPIWGFASITKVDYLKLSSDTKSSLIHHYYDHMISLERNAELNFVYFYRL